jgi:Uma2 family endonuclease
MLLAPETTARPAMTAAEFDAWVALPENQDHLYEWIAGEIFDVPSNPFASEIAALISFFIRLFMLQNQISSHVTGADGGYWVNGERYAPDVAYISAARQPQLATSGYNPNPPELAVEVISDPENSREQDALRRKIANYLVAGVLLWVVNPFARYVEVYAPGQPVKVLTGDDVLDGGGVLPGFALPIGELWPTE